MYRIILDPYIELVWYIDDGLIWRIYFDIYIRTTWQYSALLRNKWWNECSTFFRFYNSSLFWVKEMHSVASSGERAYPSMGFEALHNMSENWNPEETYILHNSSNKGNASTYNYLWSTETNQTYKRTEYWFHYLTLNTNMCLYQASILTIIDNIAQVKAMCAPTHIYADI